MMKDIKALENYLVEREDTTLTSEHVTWVRNKIQNIMGAFADLEQKVFQAETKEKLGIERQKEFGISQTKVEDSRHAHILVEIQALSAADIKVFNRSSYPFLPRHKQPFKKNDETQGGQHGTETDKQPASQ